MKKLFTPGRFTILDGGLGTMLQAAGLPAGMAPELFAMEQPEALVRIHTAYREAGAEMITACTFGANAEKLAGSGYLVEQVVEKAVALARAGAAGKAAVALDVGPLGRLLEPGGDLAFEDALAHFAQIMRAGEAAGADLVLIETMGDLYEARAAVLAAQENTQLPILVSMTFEADGRSFAGTPVEAFAAAIGALRPLALGLNCSLGPAEIMPVLQRLCAATSLPVFAMPNAGLPDAATGAYHLTPEDFLRQMEPCHHLGVQAVGGCCGTTPQTIRLLAEHFGALAPKARTYRPVTRLCGATRYVEVTRPLCIGERINPTGKPRLRQALQEGDFGYLQRLAAEQEQAGADILDINVGAPGVDEVTLLPAAVKAVQAVSGLPLQLDSANPQALAAALRVCCGRAIVNSTTGEKEKMAAVLPLCRRYGAVALGLTLDEDGIPATAEARLAIAEKILAHARQYGLATEDVAIDCLTLSAAAEPDAAATTLAAVRLVKEKLNLATVLGVSNISFGLPNRPLVNRSFFSMALAAGLDLAILNPMDGEMMGTLLAARLLLGSDEKGAAFVVHYSAAAEQTPPAKVESGPSLRRAIEQGLKDEAVAAIQAFLAQGGEGMEAIQSELIPALDTVGRGFEDGSMFLPQLLAAAAAATAAFDVVRAKAAAKGKVPQGPPIVIATVQGDVHDIGKNIARVILENYGFTVIDLGRDVPPERVVQAAMDSGARLVGLSALMTTTLPAMEATIRLLRAALPKCKVMCGGAVLTEGYVKSIGGDCFAKDATVGAEYARRVHGML